MPIAAAISSWHRSPGHVANPALFLRPLATNPPGPFQECSDDALTVQGDAFATMFQNMGFVSFLPGLKFRPKLPVDVIPGTRDEDGNSNLLAYFDILNQVVSRVFDVGTNLIPY